MNRGLGVVMDRKFWIIREEIKEEVSVVCAGDGGGKGAFGSNVAFQLTGSILLIEFY